jgi:hypothetical protein
MVRKFALITCLFFAVAGLVATCALAQDEETVTLKTNAPIELPRFVLGPGTYDLRFIDDATGTQVVEVTGKDGKNYGLFQVRPVSRLNPTDHLVVKLQPESGAPARVKDWFIAGETTGFAPIYPSAHAGSIAGPPTPSGAGN